MATSSTRLLIAFRDVVDCVKYTTSTRWPKRYAVFINSNMNDLQVGERKMGLTCHGQEKCSNGQAPSRIGVPRIEPPGMPSRSIRSVYAFVRIPWIPVCIIRNRSCKPNPQYSHVSSVHCSAVAALHQGAPPPWLRPAYCFASVIVWRENKNVYNTWPSYLFYFDGETISGVGGLCFEGVNFSVNFFGEKMHPVEILGYAPDSGWSGLKIFWPRNDLAALSSNSTGTSFPVTSP